MATPAVGPTNNSYVDVEFSDSSHIKIQKFLIELEADISSMCRRSLHIAGKNTYDTLSAADIKQLLLSRQLTGVELCVRNILLESILKLEKKSGFASFIATLFCIKLAKDEIQKSNFTNHCHLGDITEDLHKFSRLSRRASFDDAMVSISQYIKDPLSSHITLNACNMVGHSGHIYIDKEYSNKTCIELMSGYTFPYGPSQEFVHNTRMDMWKEANARVVIIDGIIESVGEIHKLLEAFFEKKHAGVIVCRGMKEEVLGTLIANKNRDTLNIVPIIVPYDLEGINSLNDIAVTCNSDIISSIKGDLISSIEFDDIATVDKVTITNNRLVISNDQALANVRRHVMNILDQKEHTRIQDKKDLFDKRTKALSSVTAHVRLGTDLNNRNATLNRMHHGIKLFKEIARYGIIDLTGNFMDDLDNRVIKELLSDLTSADICSISAYDTILGLKVGFELSKSIISAEAYLLLDRRGS